MSVLQFNLQNRGHFDRYFDLAVGALSPYLEVQLLDGASVVALTTATATFTMKNEAGTKVIDGVAATISDAANGKVKYQWAGTYHANTVTPVATGSAYHVGDTLTVSGGTFTTAATVNVDSINGTGGITGLSITDAGLYSVCPSGHLTLTGGFGTLATADLTFVLTDTGTAGIYHGYYTITLSAKPYIIPDGVKQNLIIRMT